MKPMFNITMKTTALVTTATIIFLGIYDLVVVMFASDTSLSVSRFLINAGFQAPFFTFALGYVAGHLTGYAKPVKSKDLPDE